MEFLKVLALRGPNIWTRHPVLEAWIDLGAYSDLSSEEVPGFNDRLMAWLPTLEEHRCSLGVRGGFFERLRRGTYPAHILEHVALELQGLAGSPVRFGRARAAHVGERVYKVAVEFEEEPLARDALEEARTLLLAAYDGRPFDLEAGVARLRKRFAEVSIGPSTAAIVAAARARGIPTRRLGTGSLVLLGHGASQRRIWTAETDRTSAVAQEIAQDKDLTRMLLDAVGVPVPEGRPVHSAEDAWDAAEEIGPPVVVKPRFGNQGRAVATNLATREAVVAAYEAAHREGQGAVLVERWVEGDDYRLLVVGDRLVAAARRLPAQVVGDGARTVRQLVEEANRDPRRSEGHATALSKLKLDDPVAVAVLAEQGLTPESVPDAGRVVLIRRNANLSTGGTAEDVTDAVHPEIAARAVEAARVVGLDIAGIDLLAQDVSRPLAEQSAAVVEVNAGPGLRMHLEPSSGTPRPVAEAIIDLVFPPGAGDGRIPIVAVTGVNGKTTTTRLIAHLLRKRGLHVAWTCTDGLYLDDRRLDAADCSGPRSAQAALLNPAAEAAVLETARGGILRNGLGFDACDVAVVTNIGEGDHLGLADVHTPEELARVKSVIVRNVRPSGAAVLNAADPLVAAMAEGCPGRVCFFARDPDGPVLAAHRARGGAAAFIRRGVLTVAEDGAETPILPLSEVPLTLGGRVAFQVENALAATAAAWLAGCPVPALRAGLASFAADTRLAPGRFNVLRGRGATVVLDYGHNVDSLRAVGASLDAFPHRRRLAMFTVAGDRRDRDVIDQGALLADLFDVVVIYEDACVRGRAPGEIVRLMREGISRGRRLAELLEAPGEFAAVDLVLDRLQPGDLVLIQPDRVDELLVHVAARLGDGWTGPSLDELATAPTSHGGILADAEEDPEPIIRPDPEDVED
jgi:cyanophycin synthetase